MGFTHFLYTSGCCMNWKAALLYPQYSIYATHENETYILCHCFGVTCKWPFLSPQLSAVWLITILFFPLHPSCFSNWSRSSSSSQLFQRRALGMAPGFRVLSANWPLWILLPACIPRVLLHHYDSQAQRLPQESAVGSTGVARQMQNAKSFMMPNCAM